MATLATGLLASFGPAGLTPARFRLEVSPFHLRFLPFHAFPSAITMPTLSRPCLYFLLRGVCATVLCVCRPFLERSTSRKDTLPRQCLYRPQGITGRTTGCT